MSTVPEVPPVSEKIEGDLWVEIVSGEQKIEDLDYSEIAWLAAWFEGEDWIEIGEDTLFVHGEQLMDMRDAYDGRLEEPEIEVDHGTGVTADERELADLVER